ncbi:hypothetical protein N0V93_002051 [Gnomoniopsis smithogilvyi]|uniref:3-beta hydroxysteroid dehydrogenase/isomerase domain-containing protein n=1 Tax=Gnomoniopsis smithogilvyi TaxID=1191159 RepID=A0A9W8Z6Q1_9PEZI|nr:hypothetical protein N0V93_002051 [Gnomoniopsis smithogilvyi]
MSSGQIKKALVTGASGFLATQIILLLLERDYYVIGAVRSSAKADAWQQLHSRESQSGRLSFVVVPDMQTPGAYDDAVRDVDIIFHTASPFNFTFKDNEKDMLLPARDGALSVLESAAKAKGVQKVIFTSSFAAVTSPHLDPRPGYTYTESDWNPVEWSEAVNSQDAHFVYLASKTFAEKAVWEFVKTRSPHFTVTSIVPPIILGKATQPFTSMADINQSSRVLHRLLDVEQMPHTPAYVSVDVKDCALCHILAAESDKAPGKRYLTIGSSFSQAKAAQTIAKLFPEQAHRLPEPPSDPMEHYSYSVARVEQDLGVQWTPFETTIKETFQQVLEVEKITTS